MAEVELELDLELNDAVIGSSELSKVNPEDVLEPVVDISVVLGIVLLA